MGPDERKATEDYIKFLFLTNDKQGREAAQARKFLNDVDPELFTDGVMR
jgi:hypothetical protein